MAATESILTELPLYDDKRYRYPSILGDKRVVLDFYYNSRTKGWYFDITEQEGTSLIQGLKLLPSVIHGADFNLSHYGINGYFLLLPVAPNIRFEEIDSEFMSQYYRFYYIEEL